MNKEEIIWKTVKYSHFIMSCWKLRCEAWRKHITLPELEIRQDPHIGSVSVQNHKARLYLWETYWDTFCASEICCILEGPRGWKYWYIKQWGKEQSSVSRACMAVDFLPLSKYLIKVEVDMCRGFVSSSAFSPKLLGLRGSEKWEENHSVVLEIHQRRCTPSFWHSDTQ